MPNCSGTGGRMQNFFQIYKLTHTIRMQTCTNLRFDENWGRLSISECPFNKLSANIWMTSNEILVYHVNLNRCTVFQCVGFIDIFFIHVYKIVKFQFSCPVQSQCCDISCILHSQVAWPLNIFRGDTHIPQIWRHPQKG